ncbi:MAG: response regulator [Candidatus Omnitrophota bacterium]
MERIKILLIDDEKAFCDLVKMNLELSGKFTVVMAHNGEEGVEAAKREKPDAILLDIRMPVMDGFETLESLKKIRETMPIPVIMLSAIDDDASKIRSSEMSGEYYISKPISSDELAGKIEWVLSLRGK